MIEKMAPAGRRHGFKHVESSDAAVLCSLSFDKPTSPKAETQRPRRGGTICLAADARLDNRQELVKILGFPGSAKANEPTDSAIILAAYRRWNHKLAEHLIGDFSFTIWDSTHRRLLCARDPLGIKPFSYFFSGDAFCFASDVQQLFGHPAAPKSLDEFAVADYLSGRNQEPQRTYFQGIYRLPPAHLLTISDHRARLDCYWNLRIEKPIFYKDERDYPAHFLELFRRSVTSRLRTTGRVIGVSMSGGLDSTSVAAVGQKSLKQTDNSADLLACSYVFNHLVECDERVYIQAVTEEFDIASAHINADDCWLLENAGSYTPPLDTPFIGWQSCSERMFGLLEQQGARIVLTGHGGDSLMQGSAHLYADRLRRGDLGVVADAIRFAQSSDGGPRKLYRALLQPLLSAKVDHILHLIAGSRTGPAIPFWIHADFARRTGMRSHAAGRLGLPRLSSAGIGTSLAGRQIYESVVDFSQQEPIGWYNREAETFGIEARHPFLDVRLLKYALSIPPDQLFQLGSYKPLLRGAMKGILPELVRTRQGKTSFTSFIDMALRYKAVDTIQGMLKSPLSADRGFVDADKLRKAYRAYHEGRPFGSKYLFWRTLTLETWLRRNEGTIGSSDLFGKTM
jgi:asparagine synthase (glutamine-hydrolysing)